VDVIVSTLLLLFCVFVHRLLEGLLLRQGAELLL
jgi:hypothetical protein